VTPEHVSRSEMERQLGKRRRWDNQFDGDKTRVNNTQKTENILNWVNEWPNDWKKGRTNQWWTNWLNN
jgi:hypothetical protein